MADSTETTASLNSSTNETLRKFTTRVGELKKSLDAAKREVDVITKQYTAATAELLNVLEALDIESIDMAGFTFSITTKESVRIPQTLEDKRLLFDFLKERGLFEEMVGINSQTLNSLYKSLSEEALEQGNLEFKLPGVGEPTPYKTLKVK